MGHDHVFALSCRPGREKARADTFDFTLRKYFVRHFSVSIRSHVSLSTDLAALRYSDLIYNVRDQFEPLQVQSKYIG